MTEHTTAELTKEPSIKHPRHLNNKTVPYISYSTKSLEIIIKLLNNCVTKPTMFTHAHRLYFLGIVLPPTAELLVHAGNMAGPCIRSALTQREDETSSVIKTQALHIL